MLQIYRCGDEGLTPVGVGAAEMPSLMKEYGCLWVDVVDEGDEDVRFALEKIFGEGAISEAAIAPTMRFIGTHTEATLVLLPRNMGEEAGRLRILFNPKVLVTIRNNLSNAFVGETAQSLRNLAASHPLNADLIFCRLLEEMVDSNELYIDELRDAVDLLESKAIVDEDILRKVEDHERKLGKTHDLLQSQRLIINNSVEGLLPEVGKADISRAVLLRAERKLERQLDLIDHYDRELMGVVNLNDLTLTIKLSRIMTLLTIVSTILLLPNTIATIFGIPSLPIPSQAWSVVVVIIVVSAIIPTIYLNKKRWL